MGMVENINIEAVTAEQQIKEKIKAFNPQIVVSDSPEKPYYSISYYDMEKKEWYIGYSSYFLENVYKWLFEYFEEVDSDMVEVVHGEWEPHPRHPGFDRCSVCHNCIVANDWVDGRKWHYCPECGALMDGGTHND